MAVPPNTVGVGLFLLCSWDGLCGIRGLLQRGYRRFPLAWLCPETKGAPLLHLTAVCVVGQAQAGRCGTKRNKSTRRKMASHEVQRPKLAVDNLADHEIGEEKSDLHEPGRQEEGKQDTGARISRWGSSPLCILQVHVKHCEGKPCACISLHIVIAARASFHGVGHFTWFPSSRLSVRVFVLPWDICV